MGECSPKRDRTGSGSDCCWGGVKIRQACLSTAVLFRAKGKNAVTRDVSAWFNWARQERIVLGMSDRVVYTVDSEAVAVAVFDAAVSDAGVILQLMCDRSTVKGTTLGME
ncbi:hypothetical protein NIES4103_18560 [Nostoc sp. NIES-4103]|nr:hypothetical protein NIES4103_18560 [Nostoc sp. NIES-4103]